MLFSFPAFCSTSSLTWASIITRPFHFVTASFATCAMQRLLPPAVGITTQGFVSFSRRWRYTESTASLWYGRNVYMDKSLRDGFQHLHVETLDE